jgi:hypothetical protein
VPGGWLTRWMELALGDLSTGKWISMRHLLVRIGSIGAAVLVGSNPTAEPADARSRFTPVIEETAAFTQNAQASRLAREVEPRLFDRRDDLPDRRFATRADVIRYAGARPWINQYLLQFSMERHTAGLTNVIWPRAENATALRGLLADADPGFWSGPSAASLGRPPGHEPGFLAHVEEDFAGQPVTIQFSPTPAGHFVSFVESLERELHPASGSGCPPVQRQIHRSEMYFSAPATGEGDSGRGHEIQEVLVPRFHFNDPPAANKRGFHGVQQRLANQTAYSRTGQKFLSFLGVTATSHSGT